MSTRYDTEFGEVCIYPHEHHGDEQTQVHHLFIVEHWRILSAAAYQSFRQIGLGVMLIDPTKDSEPDGGETGFRTLKLGYAPHQSRLLTRQIPPPQSHWIEQQLQKMEVTEEVLVLFLDAGRVYRVTGTPTPKEAYRLSQARYN